MSLGFTTMQRIALSVLVGLAALSAGTAHAEPGLLIIAHGAPMERWNAPVLELGQRVADAAKKDGTFKAVRTAMLEFTQPDVPSMVAELEAEGCDRIIAVPLFIAPSGHSLFDVPAVLGIYSSPEIKAVIAEEGGAIAQPKVPITLTQTLSGGDLLCTFAADEVRKLSGNPQEEALILLAHGAHNHQDLIDALMRRIASYCCGQTGVDYADWAYVGMGLGHVEHGIPAIMKALEAKKRVLVVGIYLSSTARSIHQRVFRMTKLVGSVMMPGLLSGFDEDRVFLSEQGVVAHPETVQWVLEAAKSAFEPLPKAAPAAEGQIETK